MLIISMSNELIPHYVQGNNRLIVILLLRPYDTVIIKNLVNYCLLFLHHYLRWEKNVSIRGLHHDTGMHLCAEERKASR